jgi:hypothetical protein
MTRGRTGGRKRKSRTNIGIIAEDNSDIAVLNILIGKLAKAPYLISPVTADGCGKIIGKCRGWALNLRDRGCKYLLLVHDLDLKKESELRAQLLAAMDPCPITPHLIVIPAREIEAWLLADHVAITRAMKLKEPLKKVPNPESLQRPKEYLAAAVYRKSRKARRYVNAVDNAKIAHLCVPSNLQRCRSFQPFARFVTDCIR